MNSLLNTGTDELFNLGRNLFATILLRDSQDAETWKHRAETFRRHGLVSFLTEAIFKPKELHIDHARLDDSRYRRQLIRRLKAPRPGKYRTVTLEINREKLLHDDEYVQKMAAVLAYKWAYKLTTGDAVAHLMLKHQDVETLSKCLDHMGLHQSEPQLVSDLVLRTLTERAVDANPRFQACVAEMRASFADIRADFEPRIKALCAQTLAESKARMDEILQDASVEFDRLSARIRDDFAGQAARTQAVLDENTSSGLSPQEEFRRDVLKLEREHREQNRISPQAKRLLWLVSIAAAIAGAYFVEVDGVTLVDALR